MQATIKNESNKKQLESFFGTSEQMTYHVISYSLFGKRYNVNEPMKSSYNKHNETIAQLDKKMLDGGCQITGVYTIENECFIIFD